ncbi:MAG TPA: GNAT family N-acetyltransferase [Candidatus Hydrogenedentes bacterium]|nr:GNAT family N-acetyltransferase [Candidatus Hydrogenedentota bacterium]HOV75479.1 GNAT family N-acetyltransferase [Candidatus Hydrogenedentota bacterium]
MEGPRPIRVDELPSLARLVDTVFMKGREGAMFGHFPALFGGHNARNCLVFVDKGRVVSHFGMIQRWACIDGCTVRVACVGAVSTHEAYRGRRLATRLFSAARQQALEDGVDFMLISGDRDLYRQAGAVPVGIDWTARIIREQAEAWRLPGIEIGAFRREDIPACAALYGQRTARFVRPPEDWHNLLVHGRADAREVITIVVRRYGVVCGYFVLPETTIETVTDAIEFAGEPLALRAAMAPLMDNRGFNEFFLRLQQGDAVLRGLFAREGVSLEPVKTGGTLLILNFNQLVQRLRPVIEARTDTARSAQINIREDDGVFRFQSPDAEFSTDRSGAARALFGYPGDPPLPGSLGSILPLPTLWYGINYT